MSRLQAISGILLICMLALMLPAVTGIHAATKSEKSSKTSDPKSSEPKSSEPKSSAEQTPQETSLDNPKGAAQAPSLDCTGPFAKDTTHAKLEAAFGAKHVAFKDVPTTNDAITKASVVFDDDPAKRVVVFWKDNKARVKPAAIAIDAPSAWQGPGGVRNGLSLRELVKLNGDELNVMGFGGVGGGEISGLKDAFVNLPGDCTLTIRLQPGIANPLPPRFASVTGDVLIGSKNLILRRVRPQVVAWRLKY